MSREDRSGLALASANPGRHCGSHCDTTTDRLGDLRRTFAALEPAALGAGDETEGAGVVALADHSRGDRAQAAQGADGRPKRSLLVGAVADPVELAHPRRHAA